MRFIVHTLWIGLLFFVCYTGGLLVFPALQNRSTAQNWWQENKIKAENFYRSKKKYDIILVGTSMSEGLTLDKLNAQTLTLNFVGGSSLTGLELIRQSAKLPKILIVETNWLERPVNDEFMDDVTNGDLQRLKSAVPSLLEANQPVNVIASKLQLAPTLIDTIKERKNLPATLARNIAAGNDKIDTTVVEKNVRLAGSLIRYFKQKGVRVYLMELPVARQIYHTHRATATRLAVEKWLSDIDFIPKFDTPLATSDGYHFTAASKKLYIGHLSKFLAPQL